MMIKDKLNQKLVFHQVMKASDWWKMGVIIVFFILCWGAVWFVYKEPLDYRAMIVQAESSGR